MEAQLIGFLVVVSFTLVFNYADINAYRRYKSEGPARYGLAYDEETGTTHVTGIAEDEDGYDPNEIDPSDHDEREIKNETDDDRRNARVLHSVLNSPLLTYFRL
ncbi:hypothetical protein SAMN05444004_1087 [Jannaschia faecimaris]|uniref:Uncharacterized protein n=1 Tax=Jannaschia faecimaris TaxID=1244108 RepID=A0A1H3R972_9RHOB|nr:hypothetical protein [Jannaschia faecimaris]SDZ22063.1 hypothetical protein SAMN05444004_1087 [Jannaschia faecimaris]